MQTIKVWEIFILNSLHFSLTQVIFLAYVKILIHSNFMDLPRLFLTHAKILWTHATDTKISTDASYVTHAKVLWTYNTHATHEKIWPTHLRYYATHATHATQKPTPPTLFSRLW